MFLKRESGTQSESMNQSMSDVSSFELTISASGPLLKYVRLDIMLSFIFAAGLVPTKIR